MLLPLLQLSEGWSHGCKKWLAQALLLSLRQCLASGKHMAAWVTPHAPSMRSAPFPSDPP